ncbi:MAG: hypothetical protein HQM14_21405, partial [SAR324 cluster bacterium]|nr:hypothetical protein [SAR324 cluster bacterium]
PGVGARSLRECLLVQLELLEMKHDLSFETLKKLQFSVYPHSSQQ